MKLIVVGARGVTRDLLRRLGERWQVTVVDSDADRIAVAGKVRDIDGLEGDGSSRVVLDRAGIGHADSLVAATLDDDVNLEVCRIGIDIGILRIAAVAADPERIGDYRAMDVSVWSPDSLAARQLEIGLEPRRVSSTAFAQGKAEAIEFRIAPDSPVRGASLKGIASESWLVAAILRDGRLIVPHGDTVLETDDLVTVVGAARDFSLLVRTFTSDAARFPQDFGNSVAVALDGPDDLAGPFAEAVSLTRNSLANTVIVVHRRIESLREQVRVEEVSDLLAAAADRAEGVELRFRPVDGIPARILGVVADEESVGVVVRPPSAGGLFGSMRAARELPWLAGRPCFPAAQARTRRSSLLLATRHRGPQRPAPRSTSHPMERAW